tara:strand:- start:5188 stop:5559 length:372 start_codon:yes stop_codon:yes gene_type:complete
MSGTQLNVYSQWISSNVTETYGQCGNVTAAMQAEFPELTRVRGHYYCLAWGQRQHWWLVDIQGNIVDPTSDQFPSKGTGQYEPWTEGAQEPTGKCHNCGELHYESGICCSDDCARDYSAFCTG